MLWSILIGFGIAYLAGSILSSLVFCLPMFRKAETTNVVRIRLPSDFTVVNHPQSLLDDAALQSLARLRDRIEADLTAAMYGGLTNAAPDERVSIDQQAVDAELQMRAALMRMVQNPPRFTAYPGGLTSSGYDLEAETVAHTKSITLLKEWLTPKQLAEYERDGRFTVIGNITNRRYRVCTGRTFNVAEMDGEKIKRHLCFLPVGANSQGDIMLAQKIMLEQDECAALKIANMSDANLPTVTRGMYADLIETTRRAMRNHVEL